MERSAVDVDVVVVPRERFTMTRESLRTLYERTEHPFRLVVVDGGSPPRWRDWLRAEADARGFELLRTETHLAPNLARNLGLARTRPDARYVVFLDNDALVERGWLTRLVTCAEETGAWLVGPLYLIGRPERRVVHMAGGDLRLEPAGDGRFVFRETHRHANRSLDAIEPDLRRAPVPMIEYHCLLARRTALLDLGPLDEELLSANEHADLCLQAVRAGGPEAIWLEPSARVAYVPPPPLRREDRAFYLRRWSREWSDRSLARFVAKWNLVPDAGDLPEQRHWLEKHRRRGETLLRRLTTRRRSTPGPRRDEERRQQA